MNSERAGRRLSSAADSVARAFALLFAAFSLVAAAASLRSPGGDDLWWLDMRWLPGWLAAGIGLVGALVLVVWAVTPDAPVWRRHLTAAVSIVLTALAASNGIGFYSAWSAGAIAPVVPVPLSWVYACCFGLIAWRAEGYRPASGTWEGVLWAGVATIVLVAAFPLLQMVFFGMTDYRRPADAAVVFGAKVEHGFLSAALEDRVRTGVDLYRRGLVRALVMSGGVGANGIDEADAMRARAEELGVPASAILMDHAGVNTDATVANTLPMLRAGGMRRVVTVSQFFHLPRIKLAYAAAGMHVATVPAGTGRAVAEMWLFALREIPGFWVYWVRAQARAIGGG